MSLTTCPACDHESFDIESQTCTNCSYGVRIDEEAFRSWTTDNKSAAAIPSQPEPKEDEMSEGATEQAQAEAAEKRKLYPGQLAEYARLREVRENVQNDEGHDLNLVVGLVIAEQLAGLNYILDGIRFATRNRD